MLSADGVERCFGGGSMCRGVDGNCGDCLIMGFGCLRRVCDVELWREMLLNVNIELSLDK